MLSLPIILVCTHLINIYKTAVPHIYWNLALINVLCSVAQQPLSYILVAFNHRNLILGATYAMVTGLLLLLFGGLFFKLASLHYVYQFVGNFSVLKFSHQSLMLLEYGFGRCTEQELQLVLYWMDLDTRSEVTNEADFYHAIKMMCCLVVFSRAVACYVFVCKSNDNKNKI